MNTVPRSALIMTASAITFVGALEVAHAFGEARAEDRLRDFTGCETGNAAIERASDGLLHCAGITLDEIKGPITEGATVSIDWDATEERLTDSLNNARSIGGRVAMDGLFGVAGLCVGATVSVQAERASRRRRSTPRIGRSLPNLWG